MTPMEIMGALCIALVFVLFAAWVITDLGELAEEQMLDALWDDQAWDWSPARMVPLQLIEAPADAWFDLVPETGWDRENLSRVGAGADVFPREWMLQPPYDWDRGDAA